MENKNKIRWFFVIQHVYWIQEVNNCERKRSFLKFHLTLKTFPRLSAPATLSCKKIHYFRVSEQ